MYPPKLFRPVAIAGAMTTMVAIGLMLAAYGPAISVFQERFGISESAAGTGLTFQSFAAVAGILAAPHLLPRLGNRLTMQLCLALMLFGTVVLALAPNWPVVLVSATIAGLGYGGCDLLVTQLLIFGTGERGPALMNFAHGCFGVGTVISPAILAVIGVEHYPVVFLAAGVTVLFALWSMRGLSPSPTPVDRSPAGTGPRPRRRVSLSGIFVVTMFIVLYLTHFGVQTGVGSWEPTFLIGQGSTPMDASLATSGYWLFMVAGRFLAAGLTRFLSLATLVIASCVGVAATLLMLTLNPATAVWAFMLVGFFIGPIFPNGLTWLSTTGHASGHRFAWVVAGSMVGQALTPWLIGLRIESDGSQVLPVTLFSVSIVALLATAAIAVQQRVKRRIPAGRAAPPPSA